MEQHQIERHLLRARLLITRSAVHRLGFRTMENVQENRVAFFHECHAVFKKALKLLIDDMLEVERLVGQIEGHSKAEKKLKAKYHYWLLILGLAYDSFVWTAANHDRSEVTKYYKGPKHGALVHQNIHSVIGLAEQLNQQPDVFAFPLDFSRFACITDLLRIRRHPDGGVSRDFIEVKEGAINDEVFELLRARDPDRYFAFFDKYGQKGIAQIERVVNQGQLVDRQIKLLGLQPGIYEEKHTVSLVSAMTIGEDDSFHGVIEPLLHNARRGKCSVEIIDDCLVVAALDPNSLEYYRRTDHVARCVVRSGSAGSAATLGDQEKLLAALKSIEFTDWRSGFDSVLCIPPLLRRLSPRSFLDLLFGRVHLHLHFDPSAFLRLCSDAGVRGGFLRKRVTNRLRSTPLFERRAIGYISGALSAVFTPSYLDEMFFNWRTPSAIVRHIKQLESEFPASADAQGATPSISQMFNERDLEPE
jgi:hypothetical protein